MIFSSRKIQRCRLDDRLWRLNGTWSQSLAPEEARSPPHLESSGGIAQKQTLWAIVSGQTASRLRQLLALSPIAFCPTDSDRTKYLWMQFFQSGLNSTYVCHDGCDKVVLPEKVPFRTVVFSSKPSDQETGTLPDSCLG